MHSYAYLPNICHGAVSHWRDYQREQHEDNSDLRCLYGCHFFGIIHIDSGTNRTNFGHIGGTSPANEPWLDNIRKVYLIIRQNYACQP